MPTSDEQDIIGIVAESLETGIEYLPKLSRGLGEVADLLRQGHLEEAKALIFQATEGLEWLMTVTETVLRIPQLSNTIDGYGLKLEKLREIVKEIINTLSGEDLVQTADIIEYELTENLEYWLDAFRRLDSHLKSQCC